MSEFTCIRLVEVRFDVPMNRTLRRVTKPSVLAKVAQQRHHKKRVVVMGLTGCCQRKDID
jgi:hypothetical protein